MIGSATELMIGHTSEKNRVKPFDEHDAEILAGRVYVHLIKGDDVGMFDLLEIAIARKRQETNETGFEDYRHANEIPLTASKLLPPELANMLEDHDIRMYGQLRRLTRRQVAELPGGGFGEARLDILEKVLEDIQCRWQKAKKLKDARRRRKQKELERAQQLGLAGTRGRAVQVYHRRRGKAEDSQSFGRQGRQLDLFSRS